MHILSIALGIILIMFPGVLLSNYPDSDLNCKACTRLKNTIAIQAPICEVDGSGKFTDEGIKACTETLKEQCPEFNKAECLMYTLAFPDPGAKASPIPCCRLKYMACSGTVKPFTWMEIYYTLQYGANDSDVPVYDIVEVHRHIKKQDAFHEREQVDWPGSVQNASGERGLNWVIPPMDNLTQPFPKTPLSTKICQDQSDVRCSDKILLYLDENYRHGFEENMVPNISLLESTAPDSNYNVTIELKPKCIDILVDKVKTRACQILFVRRSVFAAIIDGKKAMQNTALIFLEANVYDPVDIGSGTVLRYAYWNQEEPLKRDAIMSHCNP